MIIIYALLAMWLGAKAVLWAGDAKADPIGYFPSAPNPLFLKAVGIAGMGAVIWGFGTWVYLIGRLLWQLAQLIG